MLLTRSGFFQTQRTSLRFEFLQTQPMPKRKLRSEISISRVGLRSSDVKTHPQFICSSSSLKASSNSKKKKKRLSAYEVHSILVYSIVFLKTTQHASILGYVFKNNYVCRCGGGGRVYSFCDQIYIFGFISRPHMDTFKAHISCTEGICSLQHKLHMQHFECIWRGYIKEGRPLAIPPFIYPSHVAYIPCTVGCIWLVHSPCVVLWGLCALMYTFTYCWHKHAFDISLLLAETYFWHKHSFDRNIFLT
jgi:hypothetical protein